ncbi:MAG: hypothetical protein KDD62_11040, partial [Bdellovibrionales bacterium]|nr:hypothetical protein [Bdellovibrionales bacterium]
YGVVTLEDLVEEIVGDIFDEHDSPEDEQEVLKTKGGDLLVDGSTPVDDLNDDYDLDLPEGEYDTVAGFVIDLLDRIPDVGELVEYNGIMIRIEEVAHNRIMKLRLQLSI